MHVILSAQFLCPFVNL